MSDNFIPIHIRIEEYILGGLPYFFCIYATKIFFQVEKYLYIGMIKSKSYQTMVAFTFEISL